MIFVKLGKELEDRKNFIGNRIIKSIRTDFVFDNAIQENVQFIN